jgi:hypothetical protein
MRRTGRCMSRWRRVARRRARRHYQLASALQIALCGSPANVERRSTTRPGTAGFLSTLMLDRPTVVEITAEGPLGPPQSIQRVSKTMLVIPGQDVLGDGVVLEIHDFTGLSFTRERCKPEPGCSLRSARHRYPHLRVPDGARWALGAEFAQLGKVAFKDCWLARFPARRWQR